MKKKVGTKYKGEREYFFVMHGITHTKMHLKKWYKRLPIKKMDCSTKTSRKRQNWLCSFKRLSIIPITREIFLDANNNCCCKDLMLIWYVIFKMFSKKFKQCYSFDNAIIWLRLKIYRLILNIIKELALVASFKLVHAYLCK